LEELAKAIRDVGDASSLDSLKNTFAAKSKVSSGLSYGDTVSAEDWKTLDLDPALANEYFVEMADGTHKLIGNAEEF